MERPSETFDIVVLGAGFTGVTLTAQLCQRAQAATRILLAGDERALGLAYGAAAPMHLLNVAAGRMSMWPERPDDFVQWLVAAGLGEEQAIQGVPLSERFIPRALYGSYVRDRLQEAVASAACQVEQRIVRAIQLHREGGRWRVTFGDGSSAMSSAVAICLGNHPGALPIASSAIGVGAEERIIRDPWHDSRLGKIAPDDRVLVIGTGLTMVDLVIQREHDGNNGETIAISRRGLLPEVHALNAEAGTRITGIEGPHSLTSLTRLVRAAITERTDYGGDWRPLVDGLRPDTQRLWMVLTPEEQARFLRHLGTHWGVARHRMPPIAGQCLAAMQHDGRLAVNAGRVSAVVPENGQLVATLKMRGIPESRHEVVDWIVNCTGPGRDPTRTGNLFLLALLEAGIARSDSLRLGLETDEHDQVVGVDGRPQLGLYALGAVAMGRLYEIVAVPDLKLQCAAVAQRLAEISKSPAVTPA